MTELSSKLQKTSNLRLSCVASSVTIWLSFCYWNSNSNENVFLSKCCLKSHSNVSCLFSEISNKKFYQPKWFWIKKCSKFERNKWKIYYFIRKKVKTRHWQKHAIFSWIFFFIKSTWWKFDKFSFKMFFFRWNNEKISIIKSHWCIKTPNFV